MNKNVVLVGNPNSGKSTLFNLLTGAKQKVGNWPGVTVEKKEGVLKVNDKTIDVIDLPGLYSLAAASLDEAGIDEKISFNYLNDAKKPFVVNVLDATNLERNLYLTTQLMTWQLPMVVVLTKMDLAKKQGITINVNALSEALGTVVLESDNKKCDAIKKYLAHETAKAATKTLPLPPPVAALKNHITNHLSNQGTNANDLAMMMIENQSLTELARLVPIDETLKATLDEDIPLEVASAAYQFAHEVTQQCLKQKGVMHHKVTRVLDGLFLNRFLGLPFFFLIMYMMFFFAIDVGGAFQDAFSEISHLCFVDAPSFYANALGLPKALIALVPGGIGQGITTTLTFIPTLFALFFFLAFLEGSGYIARAAFLMDKGMQLLGLPGKAFVPMLLGFGCNVPAILGTRTLRSERDRILTILMVPFMSCSARLAIFSVFVAAFFPEGGALIVLSLYLIGILIAVFTGFILKKSLLQGEHAPLILELPNYELPKLNLLIKEANRRLSAFLKRGIRVIIPACMILSALNALTFSGELSADGQNSILAYVGKAFTPLFSPMGISQDNWPATVGLITGALAKEVVIGTLNTLYSANESLAFFATDSLNFFGQLKAALQTIPQNLLALPKNFFSPLAAASISVNGAFYGTLSAKFISFKAAYAYLLFTLLYVPCISTLAVIKKELNDFWMLFSLIWSTALAYLLATGFYTLSQMTLSWWLITLVMIGLTTFYGLLIFSLRLLFSNQVKYGMKPC